MRITQSIKYRPRAEWAAGLRSQALAEFVAPDPGICLEALANHHAFYAKRLAGVSEWQDIEPMSKQDMAALPVCTNEQTYATRSSGTTGFQVTVRNSVSERRFRQALAYRPFLFYPLGELVRQVIFVDGAEVDAADKQQWPFAFGERSYLTWRAGIAAPAEQILKLLESVRVDVIRGLTSGIVRFVEQAGVPLGGLGVQVVSPSGEHLSPAWRRLMRAAFAAPVFDRYGATETGSMAWQCPFCDDYHANADELILETDPGPGRDAAPDSGSEPGSGSLLATPLFIESQPILRYRTGDRAVLHDQPHDCRIRLPKITLLEARRDDWLIDGAGRKVSPLSFQFEKVAGLKAWRIHQLQSGLLRLYVDSETGAGELSDDVRQQLAGQLRNIVPGRSHELVTGIWQLERGGKFKRVVSDVVASD
jgi:phenylacetate-coenzyme A ligase PaaK-like adenylate-forming protein